MKVDITEFEKIYTFELLPITQLCGRNIVKKSFVLESLKKYFSTYRYSEDSDKWRDNVKIDGKNVGRKYFSILSVKTPLDIINLINCSKQSLMMEYLKQLIQKFEMQKYMETINYELDEIQQVLNKDINQLGDVEIDFSVADIWDMVQKTKIYGKSQMDLEYKKNDELIFVLINLIEEVMKYSPKKQLIIFEDVDHLLSVNQYNELIERLKKLTIKYDIYFILSTSINGYVECDKDIMTGIMVFGEVDFQMPDFNKLSLFIRENYPCNKEISDEKMKKILKKIIQNIGQSDYLYSVEDNVVCKMINQTILISERIDTNETQLEINFLKS